MIISMTANYVNDVFEDWEKIGRIISYWQKLDFAVNSSFA